MRTVAIVVALLAAPRPASAYCPNNDPCMDGGFAFRSIVFIGVLEGSFAVAGLVSAIGGANDLGHHRASRNWRIANYVFASLNLAIGLACGGLAAGNISPTLTGGLAIPHLAIGAVDLGLGIASAVRADGARQTVVSVTWRF